MSDTAALKPEASDPVIRTLRFRRARWFYLAAYLACVVASVFYLLPRTFLLIVPATFIAGMILFVKFGRHKLSSKHFADAERFADLAEAVSKTFGTHLYLRDRYSKARDKEAPIRVRKRKKHAGIRSASPFLVLQTPNHKLLVTPQTYWLVTRGAVVAGTTKSIDLDTFDIETKVDRPRGDDEVLGQTWRYATKNDERDLRFNNNDEMWRVRRHGVEIALGDLRWAIRLYSIANARGFASALAEICDQPLEEEYWSADDDEAADTDEEDGSSDKGTNPIHERSWHEVLEISPNASIDEIKRKYRLFLASYDIGEAEALSTGSMKRLLDDWDAVQRAYRQAIAVRGGA